MFGDLKNAVAELVGAMEWRCRELQEIMDEHEEGQCEFEDAANKFDYMEDCRWTAKSLLNELEEAERRYG